MIKYLSLSFLMLALFFAQGCKSKSRDTLQKVDPSTSRPNILFIMSDDHTAQAWGIYGGILEDYVHTPNIKLAFFYGNGFKGAEQNQFWDFYDLEKDPKELHNAYNDAENQDFIKVMKAEILRKREMLGDTNVNNPEILEIIEKHWND